jgi:hypothetical protein
MPDVLRTTDAPAGLTCSVESGEVVGLLGPNGAGKTTTIDASSAWPRIAGLESVPDFEGQLDTTMGGYSHLLGLATGAVFAKTRTLHEGILAHLAHNGIAVVAPLLVGPA